MTSQKNSFNEPEMHGKIKLKCSTKEEFLKWLKLFGNITLTTFVNIRQRPVKGERVVYKVSLLLYSLTCRINCFLFLVDLVMYFCFKIVQN